MVEFKVANMEVNKSTITNSAYIFGYFLSTLLLKYLLYDNGFAFSNILLLIGLVYTRFYLFAKESTKLQEGACLILFVLFDKSLLDIGNIFLLLGVACIREQSDHDFITKEISSFICGLIFLLMGWFSVGRIIVIYFLLMFYFFTIGIFLAVFIFSTIIEGLLDAWRIKLPDWIKKPTDSTSSENNDS